MVVIPIVAVLGAWKLAHRLRGRRIVIFLAIWLLTILIGASLGALFGYVEDKLDGNPFFSVVPVAAGAQGLIALVLGLLAAIIWSVQVRLRKSRREAVR
jgi:hypothetical protein